MVKKKGFTLIELQIALVMLAIMLTMTSGVQFFLVRNTFQVVSQQDPELILASVFEHLERNISRGYRWYKTEEPEIGRVWVFVVVPNASSPNSRASDRTIAYRFDSNEGNVLFYPQIVTGDLNPASEVLAQNLVGGTIYVSSVDPNLREVFIRLESATSGIYAYGGRHMSLSRTIRMRALW